MCGIVGVGRKMAYTFPSEADVTKMVRAFELMLVHAQDRGTDATGIAVCTTPKKISDTYSSYADDKRYIGIGVAKESVRAEEFLKSTAYQKIRATVTRRTTLMLGHTRAATGASPKDNRNNHPHIAGNIVGVHNGHIYNWRELRQKFDLKLRGSCDSEVIFALLNLFLGSTRQYKEAIQRAAKELKGNYAVVFTDVRYPDTVGFIRRGAPMYINVGTFPAIYMFGSKMEYIINAYSKAKLGDGTSEFINMYQYILDDNRAVVFDSSSGTGVDWMSKVPSFDL